MTEEEYADFAARLAPYGISQSEFIRREMCIRDRLGAIHRAFCPGCKFEVMLCLVGGQGAGKSTFFRLLAVKDLSLIHI